MPDCWIYVQERSVKLGRLQIFNNWSPYMVERSGTHGLDRARVFLHGGRRTVEHLGGGLHAVCIGELEKIGVIEREDVLDATHIRVKKAYPAYFGTYGQVPTVRDYLDGFSNLYCIGRNGQHRYNNMDHSMMTAMDAVRLYIADPPTSRRSGM